MQIFFSVAKTTNYFTKQFDQLVCLEVDLIKNLKKQQFLAKDQTFPEKLQLITNTS